MLYTALSGGATEGRDPAVFGSAGVVHSYTPWLDGEVLAGIGASGLEDAAGTTGAIRIALGARIAPWQTKVRPFLWAAGAHYHESAWSHAKQHPAGAVFGAYSGGTSHRTGFELGLGVSAPIVTFAGEWVREHVRNEARAYTVLLPIGEGHLAYFLLEVSMGIAI